MTVPIPEVNAVVQLPARGLTVVEEMYLHPQQDSFAEAEEYCYIPPGDTSSEQYRLATFSYSSYPEELLEERTLTVGQLAQTGFYFRGRGKEIQCYSCGRVFEEWNLDDNPQDTRLHYRGCRHVMKMTRR